MRQLLSHLKDKKTEVQRGQSWPEMEPRWQTKSIWFQTCDISTPAGTCFYLQEGEDIPEGTPTQDCMGKENWAQGVTYKKQARELA